MSNELARQAKANTGRIAQIFEPAAVSEARKIHDEVVLADYKVKGALALAGKFMQGARALHEMQEELSQGDPALCAILSGIEARALNTGANIQRGLYGDFPI